MKPKNNKTKDSWEWEYDEDGNAIELDKTKKLKIDIPDNPFENGEDYEDELYEDEEEGFDDPDERLDQDDWDLIKQELERTGWKSKKKTLEEYFRENQEGIQRGFYCYIVGCMSDESIEGHIEGYRNLIKKYFTDKETSKLPKEIKKDYVTMDFRKEQIEQTAERLSSQVMEDLFLMLNVNSNNLD